MWRIRKPCKTGFKEQTSCETGFFKSLELESWRRTWTLIIQKLPFEFICFAKKKFYLEEISMLVPKHSRFIWKHSHKHRQILEEIRMVKMKINVHHVRIHQSTWCQSWPVFLVVQLCSRSKSLKIHLFLNKNLVLIWSKSSLDELM